MSNKLVRSGWHSYITAGMFYFQILDGLRNLAEVIFAKWLAVIQPPFQQTTEKKRKEKNGRALLPICWRFITIGFHKGFRSFFLTSVLQTGMATPLSVIFDISKKGSWIEDNSASVQFFAFCKYFSIKEDRNLRFLRRGPYFLNPHSGKPSPPWFLNQHTLLHEQSMCQTF